VEADGGVAGGDAEGGPLADDGGEETELPRPGTIFLIVLPMSTLTP
jgi:hypothetical protein